jgi:hypothetical protein
MSSPAPAWLTELEENGFAVVRGVLTPERASEYVAAAYKWASQFGWSAEDRSTWNSAHLPAGKAGVVSNYGAAHEKWVWDARMYVRDSCSSFLSALIYGCLCREPKVGEAFARVWGTDRLIVSFDAM